MKWLMNKIKNTYNSPFKKGELYVFFIKENCSHKKFVVNRIFFNRVKAGL